MTGPTPPCSIGRLTTTAPQNIATRATAVFTRSRSHALPAGQAIICTKAKKRYAEASRAFEKRRSFLTSGSILAVKGLGGYHLACDASNPAAVAALRERKYRKEKPFAIMARDLEVARQLVELSAGGRSTAPIQSLDPLCLHRRNLNLSQVDPEVAPENNELGVMLPYTPLHYLLFAAGAPEVLVMTSANRSSEPIAYEDDEALDRLSEIADAFLIGERPIARRVDDSVARDGVFGPVIVAARTGLCSGRRGQTRRLCVRFWLSAPT